MWKITDFGLVAQGTSKTLRGSTGGRGTTGYRAPELLGQYTPQFNNKVDIWSIGCIVYELAARHKAFADDVSVFRYSLGGITLSPIFNETFDNVTAAAIDKIIRDILQIDPSLRPTAATLLADIGELLQKLDEPTQCNVKIDEEFSENIQRGSTPTKQSPPSVCISPTTGFLCLYVWLTGDSQEDLLSTFSSIQLSEEPQQSEQIYRLRFSKDPLKSQLRVKQAIVNVLSTRIATLGTIKSVWWIHLWDALSGSLILERNDTDATGISFSEGGQYLLSQEPLSVDLIDAFTGRTFDEIKIAETLVESCCFTENEKRLGLVIKKAVGDVTQQLLPEGDSSIGVLRPPSYDGSQLAQDVVEISGSHDPRVMFYSGNGSKLFIAYNAPHGFKWASNIMGWDIKSRQVISRLVYPNNLHSNYFAYTHSDQYVTIRSTLDIVGPTVVFSLNSDAQNPVQRFPRVFLAAAVRQGVVYIRNQRVSIWSGSNEQTSIKVNLDNSMAGTNAMCALAVNDQHRTLTLVFSNGEFEFYER